MLSIKRWNDPDKFWDLVEEWLALLKSLQYKSAFLTPCWLGLTFDYFARDEELSLIEIRNSNELIGVIPLVARIKDDHVTFSFPSGHGFGHYDFPIDQRHRNEAIRTALLNLLAEYPELTLKFDLHPISEHSPTIWALEKVISDMGGSIQKESAGQINYFDLPESLDEFVIQLKQGDRKKVTKWVKRSRRLADMEIIHVTDPSQMDPELDKLFRITKLLGKQVDIGVETFLRECARVLSGRGMLEFVYLRADSWPVAAAIVLKFNGVAQILIEDVDPNAMNVQAGTVLFTEILKTAISNGMHRLEILDDIEGLSLKSIKTEKLQRLKAEIRR